MGDFDLAERCFDALDAARALRLDPVAKLCFCFAEIVYGTDNEKKSGWVLHFARFRHLKAPIWARQPRFGRFESLRRKSIFSFGRIQAAPLMLTNFLIPFFFVELTKIEVVSLNKANWSVPFSPPTALIIASQSSVNLFTFF